jgi:hypothetical protein
MIPTPLNDNAFAFGRFLIDELKKQVLRHYFKFAHLTIGVIKLFKPFRSKMFLVAKGLCEGH